MLWNEIKGSTSDEDKLSKQVINNVTASCIHNYIVNDIHRWYITIKTAVTKLLNFVYNTLINSSSNVTKSHKWDRV